MDKAHDVQSVSIGGAVMILKVDGAEYRIDLAKESARLARSTPAQRMRFEISPSGYGIHWPDMNANTRATFIVDKQGRIGFIEKYGKGELPDPEKILTEVKKLH